MPSHSLDAVDEGSVVAGSPVPPFSAAAFANYTANHTYPVLPSELLIRNANFSNAAPDDCTDRSVNIGECLRPLASIGGRQNRPLSFNRSPSNQGLDCVEC